MTHRRPSAVIPAAALLAVALLAGCTGSSDDPADMLIADVDRPGQPELGPGPSPDTGPSDAAPSDAAPPDAHPALLDPALAMEQAPDTFAVYVETTNGVFYIDVTRAWSPLGADRFYNLARIGFLDDCTFFRVIDGFVAQTGLHGTPLVGAHWQGEPIAADPVVESNVRGTVSFATVGGDPETRRTQFFINYGDNSRLDGLGFSPFGRVRDMTVVDGLYAGYGDGPPQGEGPDQARIRNEGNAYLRAEFPDLDHIIHARVVD